MHGCCLFLPCRNGFTRPAACSGRCVGSVSGRCSEGRFFLRFRNGPERNGGFSGWRKEAFRFPPSRRSGLSVRFVPFRRTGGIFCAVPARRRHYLRFSRRVRSSERVSCPGKLAISGILSNFVYLSGGACTMVLFSLRGEKRACKSMVYTAVYNYKLYFIIIRMIYCVFLPPVTDRMREVSVRDCRGRSDTRVSPVTCAERYGY